MKLNCDMGESFGVWSMGSDAAVMPYIDMANIACGFHASDPHIMSETIASACKHNVTIGAHPSYPDLVGFGRKEMSFSVDELINITLYQVGALQALCRAQGTKVSYVKPHGALYNMMMRDVSVYTALVKAVSLMRGDVSLMIMAVPHVQHYCDIAQSHGVSILLEAFCDRAYNNDGLLQSRQEAGAVYSDLESIVTQANSLIFQQQVLSYSGQILDVTADTICVHGDGDLAVSSVKAIRHLLSE
jgi:UPF0271 protein